MDTGWIEAEILDIRLQIHFERARLAACRLAVLAKFIRGATYKNKKTRIPILIYATDNYPASTGGKDKQRTWRQRSFRRSTRFSECVKLCRPVQASPGLSR